MRRDGVTSLTLTAKLEFDTTSVESGNTWTKTFNISLPATASVSEGMDTYYSSGDSNVTVHTQEDMDYLYVTLDLNNNPGVWGVKNTVEFDADALELVSEVEGSLSSYYTIKSSLNDRAYTLLAYRDNVRESYATGTFVTLTFKKKAETIDMNTALTIKNDQTIDDQAQPVIVNDTFDMSDFTSVPPTDDNTYLTSDSEIVNSLGKHISERAPETLTLYYQTYVLVAEQDISAWFHETIDKLDSYAYFVIQRYTATASKYTKDDVYYYTLTYTIEYYTTNAEEQAFEEKLDEVIAELNLSGKSDIEKILLIYDYVCENVTYDTTAAHSFTAYGALIEGKAVCQGYALLLMRMLEEASIDADVILGDADGTKHMWNIVKLDGECFLLDATWDSTDDRECYFWFLKGSDDFDGHTPDSSYAIGTSKDNHDSAAAVSHDFVDATCDSPATCDECHTTTGDALGHLDVNRNHACDRGCEGMLGEHADSATDNNYLCDYGCGTILEACSGVIEENNYVCVVCGNEVVKDSVTTALNKAIEDLEEAIANGDVKWNDKITALTGALGAAELALEENKAELVSKIEAADQVRDEAIKAVQKNLDDAKAELDKAITEGDTALNDKISALNEALATAKAALEATDSANKSELVAKIDEAYASLDGAIKAIQKNLDEIKAALEEKDNELQLFIMIVCAISGVAFCGCGTLAVFYIIDKKKQSK